MARPKRKREAAVIVPAAETEPTPTSRRRRSQAGHEPTAAADPKSTNTPPEVAKVADVDASSTPKNDKSTVKESKTARNEISSEVATPEPEQAVDAATFVTSDVGDDHAENEEKKTTSQADVAMEIEAASSTRQILNTPASAVLLNPKSSDKVQKQTRRSAALTPDGSSATTTPESNHVNSNNANGATVAEESAAREERIRAALKHRKLLLLRVQQSKKAAQQRVDAMEQANPETKDQTDEQETLAFQDMVRTVTAAARKQARGETATSASAAAEQRSVSLRRSSGVGKRMNAAISSLTGGTDELRQHAASILGGNSALSVLPDEAGAMDNGAVAFPKSSTLIETANQSLNGILPKSGSRPPSATGHGSHSRKGHDGLGTKTKNHTVVATGAPQPYSATTATNGGISRKSMQQQQHPYNLVPQAPPRVICPETSALRERRDEIRIHLAKMLQDRHHRSEIAAASHCDMHYRPHERRASSLSVSSSFPSLRRASLTEPGDAAAISYDQHRKAKPQRIHSHIPLWQGPDPAPKLPQRRKTHWDTVLDEMRWMATDFMEERKWKTATARLLAVKVAEVTEGVVLPESQVEVEMEDGTNKMEIVALAEQDGASDGKPPSVELVVESASEQNDVTTLEIPVPPTRKAQFHDVTDEEAIASRTVAKLLSGFVMDFVAAESRAVGSEIKERAMSSRIDPDLAASNGQSSFDPDSVDPVFSRDDKAALVDRASKHVDSVLAAISDGPAASSNKKVEKVTRTTHGFRLSADIANIVSSIEDNWGRVRVGAVLHGPVASGKTVAACSLLWRHRALGPQLLVCSTGSIIRWLHELGRLSNLNLKTLGPDVFKSKAGSKRETPLEDFGAHDIVVCRYEVVSHADVQFLSKFHSIVVDCRFPSGYAGSTLIRELGQGDATSSVTSHAIPTELASAVWWSKLTSAIETGDTNRLLVDTLNTDELASSLRNLSKRQLLEVVSLRVAFLIGSQAFVSSGISVEKAMLTWARYRSKSTNPTGSKLQGVKSLLSSILKSLYSSIEGRTVLEDRTLSSLGNLRLEVRRCQMTANEHDLYDRACRQVCSTVSKRIDTSDIESCALVAKALLVLRRHCTHSNMGEVLRALKMRSVSSRRYLETSTTLQVPTSNGARSSSASQPNREWARYILAESSKFRHLVAILIQELGKAGGDSASFKSLVEDEMKLGTKSKTREAGKDSKKIVILATLPEIQVLVAALLDAIGIDNALLLSTSPAVIDQSAVSELSWVQSQLLLSKFNSDSKSIVNVVIGSPAAVASDDVGIGVEGSDLIVCVDEDWSGRSELVLRALVSRCCIARESEGKGSLRFVRLVSDNTCEEKFLSGDGSSKRGGAKLEGWTASLDTRGVYVAPARTVGKNTDSGASYWHHGLVDGNQFVFPGCNLFAQRGQALSDVLCQVIPLQTLLMVPTTLLFLPLESSDDSGGVEMMILKQLIDEEERASTVAWIGSPPTTPPPHLGNTGTKVVLESIELPLVVRRSVLYRGIEACGFRDSADTNGCQLVLPDGPSPMATGITSEATAEIDRDAAFCSAPIIPTECAASVLFYSVSGKPKDPMGHRSDKHTGHGALTAVPTRSNFYSALFSGSLAESVHDGNQGSEALVYFPPIFPRMQECATIAKHDIDSLWSSSSATKRHITGGSKPMDEASSKSENLQRVITEDEASHSDAASVLMDLFDDYGLAGIGAVPLPRDSALTASNMCRSARDLCVDVTASNEWFSSAPSCDTEEFLAQVEQNDSSPETIILFVSRKRPRGSIGHLGNSQLGRSLPASWNGDSLASSGTSFFRDFNGSLKKAKKPPVVSAFNRIPQTDTAQQFRSDGQGVARKDDYRNRLLNTLRRSSAGATLFEAPMFQSAAVHVRKKVSQRLLNHFWTSSVPFDAGPGLPLLISKQHSGNGYSMFEADPHLWTSIVKRLQNRDAVTGSEAIELSKAQRGTLKRSLAAPCRVDFGPFQCGFLSSPSGMTVATPPKPRIGVTLPMGVKVTSSTRELDPMPWSGLDDRKLQNAAIRFGMNWILAARVLSGLQDVVYYSRAESKNSLPLRAARSCRDRFQRLARSNPSLVLDVKQPLDSPRQALSEKSGRRVSIAGQTSAGSSVIGKSPKTVLLVPSLAEYSTSMSDEASKATGDEAIQQKQNRKPRRTFIAFQRANIQKRSVPITIPGSIGASSESHPSHDQAVQTSVSASWTGRPTDMWPLQLLDAADKQRMAEHTAAEAAAAALRQPPIAARVPISNGVLPTNRHPEASVAPHNHHRMSATSTSAVLPVSSLRAPQGVYPSSSTTGHATPRQAALPLPNAVGSAAASAASSSAKQSFAPPPTQVAASFPAPTGAAAVSHQLPSTANASVDKVKTAVATGSTTSVAPPAKTPAKGAAASSAIKPVTKLAVAKPSATLAPTNPANVAKPVVNPLPTRPVANPLPVKPVANHLPAKPVANPLPAKPVANPASAKPATSPPPAKAATNALSAKAATRSLPAKAATNPSPSKPAANPPTTKPPSNPLAAKAAASPIPVKTAPNPAAAKQPATIPLASKPAANPLATKAAVTTKAAVGPLATKAAAGPLATKAAAGPLSTKAVASPLATRTATNPSQPSAAKATKSSADQAAAAAAAAAVKVQPSQAKT